MSVGTGMRTPLQTVPETLTSDHAAPPVKANKVSSGRGERREGVWERRGCNEGARYCENLRLRTVATLRNIVCTEEYEMYNCTPVSGQFR